MNPTSDCLELRKLAAHLDQRPRPALEASRIEHLSLCRRCYELLIAGLRMLPIRSDLRLVSSRKNPGTFRRLPPRLP